MLGGELTPLWRQVKKIVTLEISQGHIGGVAVRAVRHDVAHARLQLHVGEQVGKFDSFPDVVQLAPGGHAVKIGLNSGARKEGARRELYVSVASFLYTKPKTRKRQVLGSNGGTGPTCNTGKPLTRCCPGGTRSFIPRLPFSQRRRLIVVT